MTSPIANRKFVFSFFILLLFNILTSGQTLSSDRSVNWSISGFQGPYPTPSTELNILAFGGNGNGEVDNTAAFQNAVSSLNGNPGVVVFPPGNYFFISSLQLTDGIIIKGSGSENTTLTFDIGGSQNLINVEGSDTGTSTPFVQSSSKGDTEISVQNNANFSVGDYIRIVQNDTSLVTSSWAIGTVGQIVKILEINANNIIKLESDLRIDFNLANTPKIVKLNMVKNVGIECLKITRLDETNPSQTSSVRFKYAAQSWVRGIESDTCNFSHITIDASTNITIEGSYFHHAFNYGGGGRAYGVMIQQTGNECKVENNVFEHLRHSMIVQSGANGNVFTYNYSTDPFWTGTSLPDSSAGDIVCHGNYPFANLFEGNIAQQTILDSSHGKNGPLNTFLRNRKELYGLVMTDSFSHYQNFIGNEITNGPNHTLGSYYLLGNNHFEYGNNIRETIYPIGTSPLNDTSYYYSAIPDFFPSGYSYPPIGIPNIINTGSIPAKDRFFSGSQITECPSPSLSLPVELINFSGKIINENKVLLNWTTASQINHDYFRLERSWDGHNFEYLGKKENEIDTQHKYAFVDLHPFVGFNYYRLSQIDLDGTINSLQTISINYQPISDTNSWEIYPTLFSEEIVLENKNGFATNSTVKINTIYGQIVYESKIESSLQFLDLKHLAKGSYYLFISDGKNSHTTQLIIKK